MKRISIALVEPEHEVNAGHIARLMKNFGLTQLLLVKPTFDMEKAKMFATHGKDVLGRARIVEFDDLKSFDPLVGTTAIRASNRLNLVRDAIMPREAAAILAARNSNACIVLGREATGLTNHELSRCDIVVSIDTPTDYKTLNISHALAILLYEIFAVNGRKKRSLADPNELQLLVNYALALAGTSGVRIHKMKMLETALKRIMSRGMATSKEAMILVTLLRGASMAMERKHKARGSQDKYNNQERRH